MTANLQAIEADIERLQQALGTTPPDSPDRARRLAELGTALGVRFAVSHDVADLDASIVAFREAVGALAPGHPDRGGLLRALGDSLRARFERTGDTADQEASDSYYREAALEEISVPPASRAELPDWGPPLDRARAREEYDYELAEPPQSAPSVPAPAPEPPPRPAPAPPRAAPPPAPGSAPGSPGRVSGAMPPDVLGGVPPSAPTPQPAPAYGATPSAGPAPAADQRLEFAAAYQRVVERARPYPLLFVVHRPADRDIVRALIERRAPQLGGAPAVSQGAAAQKVRSGTTLRIVPSVIGATFEPERIDVVAGDAVRELAFRMTVPGETPAGPIDGCIDIFVGPLIIGQVPVSFDVRSAQSPVVPMQTSATKLLEIANASIFDKIFISYSHRDSAVVDLCVLTYQGLGVTVLVDRLELRSGDVWRATLTDMVESADIFQLYWSSAAAESSEVQHEWRMALGLSKSRDRFIRPLYWETPLPPIPEPLRHLHFGRIDLKQLRKAAKSSDGDEPGFLRRALWALRLR